MFTGIVEKTTRILAVASGPSFKRITIANTWPDLKEGDSIAINGVCLTIAELSKDEIGFDVIKETLSKTNLGLLTGGDVVNVERAMRIGDRFDGHFVQGHVDGVAPLIKQTSTEFEFRLTLEAPHALAKYLAPEGSICIDGVSLTIAAVNGNQFDVALIPTTLKITNLANKNIGWPFNIEADMIARHIVRFMEQRSFHHGGTENTEKK